MGLDFLRFISILLELKSRCLLVVGYYTFCSIKILSKNQKHAYIYGNPENNLNKLF